MRDAVHKVKTKTDKDLDGLLQYVCGPHPTLLTAYLLSSYNIDNMPSFKKLSLYDLPWALAYVSNLPVIDGYMLWDQYQMADEFVKLNDTEAERVHVANAVLVKCFPEIMNEINI